jgi:hypothetical protein
MRCIHLVLSLAVLAAVAGCGGTTPSNENANAGANDNSSSNDNGGGTGNTVDDLPDPSQDDGLGSGAGLDVVVPGLLLLGYDQSLELDFFTQLAGTAAGSLGGQLLDVIPELHVATVLVGPGTEAVSAEAALSLDRVEYAELDIAGFPAGTGDALPGAASSEFGQYHLFTTNVLAASVVPTTGTPTIAVLDSGCDLTHPEFLGGRVTSGFDYVGGSTQVLDTTGHGTGVISLLSASTNLGTMAGIAPQFEVTVHKVCDLTGACPLDAVVLGIIGALNGNADDDLSSAEIAAADVLYCGFSFSTESLTLARAIFEAERRGVTVIAPAGNNGRASNAAADRFPAGFSTTVSVAATDVVDAVAPFTNRASTVDVAAPGVDLLVAAPSGQYRYVDGSSYAAALVAGAAARILDRDGSLRPDQVKAVLQASGDTLPGVHALPAGTRRLNVAAALIDESAPFEPYIIRDAELVAATGVDRDTLITNQAGATAEQPVSEAFGNEHLHLYGYFGGNGALFELVDGDNRHALVPVSLATSTIDLFLSFVRGIELGQITTPFSVLQEAVVIMPELGGTRRPVTISALVGDTHSEPRTIVFDPLEPGYNIVGYKNFDSSVWHSLETEADQFNPTAANIQLSTGGGARPEINWTGNGTTLSVSMGSILSPDYFVLSDDSADIGRPLRLGSCVGAEAAEQICGPDIVLPSDQLARVVVELDSDTGPQYATLELIYKD